MAASVAVPADMPTADRCVYSRFLKTKICQFNLRRRCTRGDACKFAHAAADLAPLPDLHCTRLCKALLTSGTCKSGDSCTFAHSPDKLHIIDANNSPTKAKMVEEKAAQSQTSKIILLKVDMCKFFRRGRCLLDESCSFAHDESEMRARPNLRRTSACYAFPKGKCKAGDNCKYSHSLGDVSKEIAEDRKPSCLDLESFEDDLFTLRTSCGTNSSDDLFAQQTICGTKLSFPSHDLLPNLLSRQTRWAGSEEKGIQSMWSQQRSLETVEITNEFSLHQDFDSAIRSSWQTSWADLDDDDDDDDFHFLWNSQSSLDTEEEEILSSSIQKPDYVDGLSSQQASSIDLIDDKHALDLSSHASLCGTETIDAPSLNQCQHSLSQEMFNVQCARLRNASGLHGLQVSVKNSFLTFEDFDRGAMIGTAARRVRSFA